MQYHGVLTLYNPQTDRFEERGTVQCCHCPAHFEVGPGKTKGRGYCTRCMGHICGADCLECIPWERKMENLEAGRPELTPPRQMVTSGWAPNPGGKILVPELLTAE